MSGSRMRRDSDWRLVIKPPTPIIQPRSTAMSMSVGSPSQLWSTTPRSGGAPERIDADVGGGLSLMDHDWKFAGMRQFELALETVHWTALLSVVQ